MVLFCIGDRPQQYCSSLLNEDEILTDENMFQISCSMFNVDKFKNKLVFLIFIFILNFSKTVLFLQIMLIFNTSFFMWLYATTFVPSSF